MTTRMRVVDSYPEMTAASIAPFPIHRPPSIGVHEQVKMEMDELRERGR